MADKITRVDVFSRDKANMRPQERSGQWDLRLKTRHTSAGASPRSQKENPSLISKSRYGAIDIVAGLFLLTSGRELNIVKLTRVKGIVAGGYCRSGMPVCKTDIFQRTAAQKEGPRLGSCMGRDNSLLSSFGMGSNYSLSLSKNQRDENGNPTLSTGLSTRTFNLQKFLPCNLFHTTRCNKTLNGESN